MEQLLSRRARTTTSSAIRDLLNLLERPGIASLAGGLPAPEGFARERIALAVERALAVEGRYGPSALQYGPTEGDPSLRSIVAARMGVDATGVLITTGSQQALELVAKAIIDPGDVVVVTSPTYLGALQAIRGSDPVLVPIPADHRGIDTDALAERLAGGLRPKACYVVSAFANPSGATLTTERRTHLMQLADHYGFLVIDDDPYGELRFRGTAPAPMRTMGANVVSLGTSSKLLAPGLRCGWLSAPAWLVSSIVKLKQATDLHTSSLSQLMVADVLADEAFLTDHLAGLRTIYRERCEALSSAVTGLVDFEMPDGGMFLWGRVPGVDTTAALPVAVEHGVAYVPGAAFEVDVAVSDTIRLSYATLTPEELVDAADRLRRALAAVPVA